ncbi:MAG: hypothetical protein WA294_17660 [Acidobacteriaceae bacterium]
MASALLVTFLSVPGISWLSHESQHRYDAHPIATVIVIAAVLGVIAYAFRRKQA